jgi:uncharacterized lipoprotein
MVIEDPEVEDVPPQAVAKIQQQNAIILQLQQQMEALTTEYQKAAIALQTKSMEHEQSIQKAQYDAQLQAALQAQKANNEKEIEAMRAAREARIAASEMEMTAIKAQLSHTEKMMGLVMDAMKQFGTGADEVVANIMPPIDKLADDAANS